MHKPIEYSAEIRPEDTERAQKTITASLFPNEQTPLAIDFAGTCPRCGDAFEWRHWLVAVSGGLRLTTIDPFGNNFLAGNSLSEAGDITVDLDCACDVDHPNHPNDAGGCGARFRIRATWP